MRANWAEGKRIGRFKVYLFKKMSQKRGMWTESTKKMIEKTGKRCYSEIDKKLFWQFELF